MLGISAGKPYRSGLSLASEKLRLELNIPVDGKVGRITAGEPGRTSRSTSSAMATLTGPQPQIDSYLSYFHSQILPHWRNVALEDVKAVGVERWLRSLDLAPATKAKIRNHLSALFSHAIRYELYAPNNGISPISSVRQGASSLREPDTLTLAEIRAILFGMESAAVRMMVAVAAASGLRRSEIRGLKWKDWDLKNLLFNLRQGVVRKHQTKLKTKASRKSLPIFPKLAAALTEWRKQTPYKQDEDWVFASPYTEGKRPYWPESALKDHIRPAADRAKITKQVGWHTFRHSLASLLGDKREETKVVQEILRHASSRITVDLYQHGNLEAKRSALTQASGIFVVPPDAGAVA